MKSHLTTSSLIMMFILLSPSTPGGEKEKLKLHVQGMHCASCVSMVKKTVRKISCIESVSVNLKAGTVEVFCDSASSRRSMVIEAIERMGYTVVQSDSMIRAAEKKPND
ncbi:MAG: heavy metal-associated domain-containing protein [Bacteroidota bacterium]